MKNFVKDNIITHNLMSFSGFKGMYIFSLLVDGPKTYKQIKYALENHEYLNETVSIDTIRVYFNSLEQIGCHIKKDVINRVAYYSIDSHPFELKISDKQVNAIIKTFKSISKSIELSDFLALTNFFKKISPYVANEKLKEKLMNASPLNNIDPDLIRDLVTYTENNTGLTIYYNSPVSGRKNIDIIADKLYINNSKLYLAGFNSEYNNYASFLVSKIISVVSVDIDKSKIETPDFKVVYQYLKDDNTKFEPLSTEKILDETDDKITVEITNKSKFHISQRIFSLTNRCVVISPEDYREEVIATLNRMKEYYYESKK